jgi:two-component system response regulator HydG
MISKNAREILENYPWPGNIRELKNVIERAVIIAREDTITQNELPEEMRTQGDRPKVNQHSHQWMPLKSRELEAVKEAILACDGNKSKAARLLGISRKALYKRLNDLGMN